MPFRRTLLELFNYNSWANDRLLKMADDLGGEQLNRAFEMGPGTIRETLKHIYGAERAWYEQMEAPGFESFPHSTHIRDLGELAEAMHGLADARSAWLSSMADGDLIVEFGYEGDDGRHYSHTKGDCLLHVANHGIHHRAQLLNMMRHVGVKVRLLDYLIMYTEAPERQPPALEVEGIRRYYAYVDWARGSVHRAAEHLPDHALDRPFEMGVGSLRKTLLHVCDAERWWLDNWTSKSPKEFVESDEQTSLIELATAFAETATARNDYLATLVDTDLSRKIKARPLPDKEFTFGLGVSMLQMCGHGTHHRAQAINMLRHLGVEPPETGYAHKMRLDQAAAEKKG